MPSRSPARLLALAGLLVLVALDVVLFSLTVSRVESLVSPHAATPPTSTARPATTPTPAPHGPVSITAAYNNVGIGLDGTNDTHLDFDGFGFSYSEQALTAAGLAPGAAVTSGGVQYVMPQVPAAHPDNVQASGQTVLAPNLSGATLLGFLGASTGGDASGTVTISYTDNTTQTETLTLSDWTLGDGVSQPDPAT